MGDFIKLGHSCTQLKMRICRDHIKPYQKSMMESLWQKHKFEKTLERETETEIETETDRERGRETERQRETEIETEIETERQRQRQRETERDDSNVMKNCKVLMYQYQFN